MRKTMVMTMALMIVTLGMCGCGNTFHGAGKDVENMGEWMQDRF